MRLRSWGSLAVAIIICELAGAIGSVFTSSAIPTWYATLVRPAFAPPDWIFGPVWTTLFALMGVSLFPIWKSDPSVAPKERRRGGILFFIQLVLNTFWSIIFFGLQSPGWAFIEIIFLWLAIAATIVAFVRISKTAAWLLVPYLAWVTFAAALNHWIFLHN